MAERHPLPTQELQSYFNNPLFSDVTIVFEEYRIPAHKNVLPMASGYFRRAFTGNFAEATSNEMHLHDDFAPAVLSMLRHIYAHEVTADPLHDRLEHELNIFAVAGKYDIPALLSRAVAMVHKTLQGAVEQGKCEGGDLSRFTDGIRRIYADIPRHGGQLVRAAEVLCYVFIEGLAKKEKFKQLLLDVPELSASLVQRLAGNRSEQ